MMNRKKIKEFMKRLAAGTLACVMLLGSAAADGFAVQAEETVATKVESFTSHAPEELTLNNTNGDNMVLLQPFSADDEFVFGADVTFADANEQQSAALIFGIKDNQMDDAHAMKANIHNKIDWNVPARVWGYGTDELKCPGAAGSANNFFAENQIDVTKTFRMEVSVQKNEQSEYVLTYSMSNENNEKVNVATGILKEGYTGGRFGLMTYASAVKFSNITVDGQKYGALETVEGGNRVCGVNGDAHAVSEVSLEAGQGFTYETDIDLAAGSSSAALTFGITDPENPEAEWIGANFNLNDGSARVFKVKNGASDIGSANLENKLNPEETIHARLHVAGNQEVTFELYNTASADSKVTVNGNLGNEYTGGYLGLLTFESTAAFTNTTYTVDLEESSYKSNLGNLTYQGGNGSWEIRENGLYSDAADKGDCFAFSKVTGTNFVYSTDIDFESNTGAAALVFRSNTDLNNKECYAVNIDVSSHKCKFWRWQKNDALQLIDEKEVAATSDETYNLKVVAYDSWILYYVNDQLVASTGDYVLQPGNKGQSTVLKEGYFGLLNWNSKVTFQNTYYKAFDETFDPLLTDISVTSTGTVEDKTQFVPTEPITLQFVKNDAATVNIEVMKKSDAATVVIKGADGQTYENGQNIPVEEGNNYITVESTVTADDDTLPESARRATMTYRVNVHRFKADEIYYNEAYRDQYHYSVKEGWGNDPNGLVYYNGTYHMFYQFYEGIKHGPMHWAHATSTDLIHWTEKPMALYPDANGAMFSGCIVEDKDNTSGLFQKEDECRLVAIITADGNGQRMKLAYSTDAGDTWKKVDEIVADWTDDPLKDAAFRDPKVFRWENKWFMVVAGGPLRIYSSDDLKTWTCESAYADLHTECPDLYPIEAADGELKWVLSRGGRFYKVGEFEPVNGKWTFLPDPEYTNSDGVMNFGRDFYAAMTYYVQDFGTVEAPNLPELIETNWMNTWEGGKCNLVAETVGQDFNGTYNLNLKLGLVKEGNQYVLTQMPIDAYADLRTAAVVDVKNTTVDENNTLLKDFVGDSYEIVAKFYPADGTRKVGFKVRTGENEETIVAYDLLSNEMFIDKSKSSSIPYEIFKTIDKQTMTRNEDGSVDMRIFVDRASVEAFAKGCTVIGSSQIFPSPLSQGAEVFVQGAAAKADITIYPMESIWTKSVITTAQAIGSTSSSEQTIYVDDSVKLNVYVLPTTASQEITWSVSEGNDVISITQDGTVTALKKGTAKVVVASKADETLTKEFTINVNENNFKTNVSEFITVNGNWIINDETLSVSNSGQNDYYLSANKFEGDFVLETDLKYERGLINLFIASDETNPHNGAGAYTIQFGNDQNVRLFPFGKDDITNGTLVNAINDGSYHHVTVAKEGQKLTVSVDNNQCLEYTFESVESFFSNGYVGLGLWDGALEVQNFFVYEKSEEKEEVCKVFPDIMHNAWYEAAVQYVYDNGIMSGSAGLFTPNNEVTRAMIVETLYKMEGQPEITDFTKYGELHDLSRDAWWENSVAWGLNNGIATGDIHLKTFSPEAPATREQLAAFLYRYAQYKGIDTTLSKSADEILDGTYVSDWSKEAFAWAVDTKLITGIEKIDTNGRVDYDLAPQLGATRAQMATILQRFCENNIVE